MELAVVQSEERVVMYTQMNILFPMLKVELDLHGNHRNLIPMQKLLQLLLMHMIQLFTLVESSGLRIIAQIRGGGNSCTKYFGVSVTQVDRCTVRIDGTANFSSSYSGTILISVKYERKNVVNGKKTYEYFENLTINSGFSKTYASNQCKNTTTEQLIVTEFALRNTNLPDYNGCNVTADLINSAQ